MANGLETLLGHVYLSGMVEDVKTGIPQVVPDAFWSVTTTADKDSGRYTRMSGSRKTLPRIAYGATPPRVDLEPIGVFDVKLATVGGHIAMDPKDYMALREWTAYAKQNRGKAEIERQVQQFAVKRDNTRVAMVHSMLSKGAIYFDSAGNLLPSSSGASLTIDYGISANNQNQLNSIITASWATTSTNIPLQLENLHERAAQLTGYEVTHAFYGAKIPGYLSSNDYAKEWLVRNQQMRDQWLNSPSTIPDGLFGIKKWIPVNRAFFVDQDGSTQTWFGDDAITFTPDIGMDVYEWMKGTYLVPTSFQPTDSMQSAMASYAERVGDWGYAVPTANRLSAELHMGMVGLPVWKVPDAIFIADATP
jgi:hypothetical protein